MKIFSYPSYAKINDTFSDLRKAIAAAAAGIHGGVEVYKDDGVASTYLYESDGTTIATPPVWADDGTGLWKDGIYIVANDNSGDPALANHGQLYALDKPSSADFYYVYTWPEEADDIPTLVTSFNKILSSADTEVQKALETIDDHIHNQNQAIEFLIDGNGFAVTSGQKSPFKKVPYACTITGWELRSEVSDTFTVDVEYNATPGSAPSSLCGAGVKPSLSGAVASSGSTLTSWTTSLASGGVITVNVTSGTPTSKWFTLALKVNAVTL